MNDISIDDIELIIEFFESLERGMNKDSSELEMLNRYLDLCALLKLDPNDVSTIDVLIQKSTAILEHAQKKIPHLDRILSKLKGKFVRVELVRKVQKMIEAGRKRAQSVASRVISSLKAIIPLHLFWQSMAMKDYNEIYKLFQEMMKLSGSDVQKIVDQARRVMTDGIEAVQDSLNRINGKMTPYSDTIKRDRGRSIIESALNKKLGEISDVLGATVRNDSHSNESMDRIISKLLTFIVNAVQNGLIDINSREMRSFHILAKQTEVVKNTGLSIDHKLFELLSQSSNYASMGHRGHEQLTR